MIDFDKEYIESGKRIDRLQRLALIGTGISFTVGLCIIVFVGWVVVKILQSQGII